MADRAATYTLARVQSLLGLSRSVVGGLIEAGFVTPQRGPRNEWLFSFQDLALLRAAHALQVAKVPPRRIVDSLARLKAMLPGEQGLSGVRFTAVGNKVAVRDRRGGLMADSGQMLMDFDEPPAPAGPPPALAGGKVASIEREAGAEAWFDRGVVLEKRNPDAAMAAYRESIRLAPHSPSSWLNLGAMLGEAGRFDDLAALSDEAVAACPGEALLHFNRAVALDHLGRLADAATAYERSLELDPTLADAHYNLGRLREQQGDHRAALRHLNAYRRSQR